MLEIIGVSKTFNPNTVFEKKALVDINLKVENGEFISTVHTVSVASNEEIVEKFKKEATAIAALSEPTVPVSPHSSMQSPVLF